ncbi:hypothetical protein D3C78_654530 [compost metagenome]
MKIKRNMTCFFVAGLFVTLSYLAVQSSSLPSVANQAAVITHAEAVHNPIVIKGWPSFL